MYCGEAGFFLSGEKVVLDQLSQVAIPKELLTKLLGEKAAEPGDVISWQVKPDDADIKNYTGRSKGKFGVKIAVRVVLKEFVLKNAHWYNL